MNSLTNGRRNSAAKRKSKSPQDRKVDIIPNQFKKVIRRHIAQNDRKRRDINNNITHREKNKAIGLDPAPSTNDRGKNEDLSARHFARTKKDKHDSKSSKNDSKHERPCRSLKRDSYQEMLFHSSKRDSHRKLFFQSSKKDSHQELPSRSSKRESHRKLPFHSSERDSHQELSYHSSKRDTRQKLPYSSKRTCHQEDRYKSRKRSSNSPFDATGKKSVSSSESHSRVDVADLEYYAELIKSIEVQSMDFAQETSKNANSVSEVERLLCDILAEEDATPNRCNINNKEETDSEIEIVGVIEPQSFNDLRNEESHEVEEILYVKDVSPNNLLEVKARDYEFGEEFNEDKGVPVSCDEKSPESIQSLQYFCNGFESCDDSSVVDDDFHADVLRAESIVKNIENSGQRNMPH